MKLIALIVTAALALVPTAKAGLIRVSVDSSLPQTGGGTWNPTYSQSISGAAGSGSSQFIVNVLPNGNTTVYGEIIGSFNSPVSIYSVFSVGFVLHPDEGTRKIRVSINQITDGNVDGSAHAPITDVHDFSGALARVITYGTSYEAVSPTIWQDSLIGANWWVHLEHHGQFEPLPGETATGRSRIWLKVEVPDSGSTAVLMGLALMGLVAARTARRRAR